jgi:predicted dehydrogenase
MNRREFLAAGSVPLAAAAVSAHGDARFPEPAARRAPQSQELLRVGIVGAGANVQAVQIPGFRRVAGVEIVAVANRSLSSSRAVTDQFGIAKPYAHWGELLDDEEIDAVLIGTWPYMHRTITLAALERGKHVLCQARMANNASEAREMLDASQRHPDLVCQLVPTSTSYVIDNVLKRLINEGFPGEVISVDIQRVGRAFPEFGGELDWRHDIEFSGYNALNIGSTYESMMRWLGRGTRVMAMSKTHVPYRRNASGMLTSVAIPDHYDIVYELANGAQVHMRMSETAGLSGGNQTWIHGSEGTIHVDGSQSVFAGKRGDRQLAPVANPAEGQAYYRVEEEFANAIRGTEQVSMLTFEGGVHYMEFTEAVYRSSQAGEAVHLPL